MCTDCDNNICGKTDVYLFIGWNMTQQIFIFTHQYVANVGDYAGFDVLNQVLNFKINLHFNTSKLRRVHGSVAPIYRTQRGRPP